MTHFVVEGHIYAHTLTCTGQNPTPPLIIITDSSAVWTHIYMYENTCMHIKGSLPEWCISTIYHVWDTPIWSRTLDIYMYMSWVQFHAIPNNYTTVQQFGHTPMCTVTFLRIHHMGTRSCHIQLLPHTVQQFEHTSMYTNTCIHYYTSSYHSHVWP